MSLRRTTHTWLKGVFDVLDGVSTRGMGVSTSLHSFYGGSGIARLATGTNGLFTATGAGASGLAATGMAASGLFTYLGRAVYGSTGTLYSTNDVVDQLKNMNILPR